MFEKIGSGLGPDAAETHRAAYTDDGKLWFVSTKGIEQKKHSFYHNTILAGGYVTAFDVKAKTWSPRVDFAPIDQDENREEAVFGHRDGLYALVYQRYEGVRLRELLKWTGAAWKKMALKTNDAAHFTTGGRGNLAFCETPQGLCLALTDEESGVVKVSELVMNADGSGAEVRPVVDVKGDAVPFVGSGGWVIGIGVHARTAVLFGGSQMCGFRWQSDRLTLVDLDGKKARLLVADNEAAKVTPPWAFGGPSITMVLSDGRWLMMGGSLQTGQCSTEKSDEVWSVDTRTCRWRKEPGTMPAALDAGTRAAATDRQHSVYLADANAVYCASF